MDPKHKDRINSQIGSLVSSTKWNATLEAKLIENKVFTNTKFIKAIKSLAGEDRQLVKLYEDVQKRGPNAFGNLVRSLVEANNLEAALLLEPSLQKQRVNSNDLAARKSLQKNLAGKVWNTPNYNNEPQSKHTSQPTEATEATTDEEYDEEDEGEEGDVLYVENKEPLLVKVKEAKSFKGPPDFKAYAMTRKIRGHVLIIDNEEFDNDVLNKRHGTIHDSNNLDILFEGLGFKVYIRRNLKYNEFRHEVSMFSSLKAHSAADMCVVAVLSHGDKGLVFSSDGRKVDTEWLLGQFNNKYCPRLKGKPKFFILQACRGDDEDTGVDIARIDSETDDEETETDATISRRKRLLKAKDPTWEDMLIAYATIPGYVAIRNKYRGTWFIESLCEVFMNNAHDMDIRDMLDEVAQNMRYYESECGGKQSCSYEVRHFYKKLFFNPGLCIADEEENSAQTKKSPM